MTFGMRPSCVATLRCGSSLARLEMQCLHQERNTTCVSSCLSSSSAVGPRWEFSCSCNWGVFVVLHNRICGCWYSLSFLLNRWVTSGPVQLVQLVVHVSAPSFVALVTSQLSEDPFRTFDSHVSTRYSQLVSMASHHKPKRPVEKIPPSFLRRSLRTRPQPALRHQ